LVSGRTAAHLVGGVEQRIDVAAGEQGRHRGEEEVEGAVGPDRLSQRRAPRDVTAGRPAPSR
jgi:hypothetical protein